ncbi:Williams-beuren syndrome critical region protein [Fasciola hepatica]|uniref:Williams-beuren syndrome critical region protein n=1 Tax=Fasciola hepatica TaxID=6192 RepID=A0A4E0RXD8_FASHE|nr:Williams-beuren syndrome critical region protein [Fasciola hepatica]
MAFNCAVPGANYNGFANDDLSTSLAGMSKADLEKLLNNAEAIKEMAKTSSQVKKSIADKESLMQKNRQLAEANLDLEPQFLVKKQELAVLYKQLSDAKELYASLKSRIDALGTNYNPSTILALMQAANAEVEERSDDLANQFVNGSMNVDDFLREFLPLRKLCNERRFKCEKLAENLSGSRPVIASRPPAPFREAPKPPVSASSSNLGSGQLYPNLSRPSSMTNDHTVSYGFNM